MAGSESHMIQVRGRAVDHLNDVVEMFRECGDTIANVVTTTPVVLRDAPFD